MSLYAAMLRRCILPTLLKRDHRESAQSHLRKFDESQFWPRQQLLDYQWQKLQQLLAHAYTTCAHYRRVFDQHSLTPESFTSIGDLERLPLLTRGDLFDHGDDLRSNKYHISELQKFNTGGTTGQRALLYRDQESFNIKLGLAWRHEQWIGRQPCDKTALLWPANMDFPDKTELRQKFKDRYLMREQMYQGGSARESDMHYAYTELKKFKPRFLKVFPAGLVRLAEYIESHNLPPLRPEAIMSTGEPLYLQRKQKIEAIFDCPVYDMYGSREVGNTACECEERNGMHIAMETQIVEFLADGQPVPYGEQGEMVITDLTNYAAPLIRYQINDYGIPLEAVCVCGRESNRMRAAVGRVTDELIGLDGDRHSGHVVGVYLTDKGPHIGQLQIIQESRKDFQVILTDRPEPTQEIYDYIDKVLRRTLGDEIKLTFSVVKNIPQEKSGKVRFVINRYDKQRRDETLREGGE